MGGKLVKNLHAADSQLNTIEFADDDVDENMLNLQVPAKVKNIHIDGLRISKDELVTKQLERLFEAKTFDSVITEAHLCKLKL